MRFGVSMNTQLLRQFDRVIARKGYTNRSEAIRDLVRRMLMEESVIGGDVPVAGTATLLYDHHNAQVSHALQAAQHNHCAVTSTTLHLHLDAHTCFEVVVLRGAAREVQAVADSLISLKGVKLGHLTLTPVRPELP